MEYIIHAQLEPEKKQIQIKLPHTFDLAQTENLYIAIQTFALNIGTQPPAIGKIRLLELDGFNGSLVQDKILDIFRIDNKYIFKERKTLDFVKLSHHSLSSLTFEVLDGNDKPIKLTKTSFITLCIKSMDKNYTTFSLHVTEEGKRKIPGFRYSLPYPIHLEQVGTWRISLSSIIFPNPNLGQDTELRVTAILYDRNVSWVYDDSNISNVKKFINVLQIDVRRKLNLQRKQSFKVGVLASKKFALVSSEPVKITFSNRLAYLLGFTDKGYTNAKSTIKLNRNEMFRGPNTVDLNRDVTEAVYIKCAQIAPSIVNNTYDHILKVVPIQSKTKKYFYYENEEPEYHNILPSTLSHLNIELCDQYMLPLPYKSTRFDKIFISFKVIHEK